MEGVCIESGLKGLFALVVLLLVTKCMSVSCAPQVLEQLQPGALGAMLVAELKIEKGVEKKYIIKQVRRWLLGKQESIGTFAIPVAPLIVRHTGCLAPG